MGLRRAYDEVMGGDSNRRHQPPRILGCLLRSETAEKHACSPGAGARMRRRQREQDPDGRS